VGQASSLTSRRPGTKGTEWLLIKKQDDAVVKGFDIDQYDESALTGRTMADIAGDQGSAQWTSSRPASRGAVKAPWLADAIAKFDKKNKKKSTTEDTEDTEKAKQKKKKKGCLPAQAALQPRGPEGCLRVPVVKDLGVR
jgi:hypothetical protein